MLITRPCLVEEISHLDLCGKIMKGNSPVTNKAPCEMSIHTNVFGQLMLDRICSNLKSPSAVTVKRVGEVIDTLKSCRIQRSQITSCTVEAKARTSTSGTRLGNCSLLLGLPDYQRRPKKDTVTSNRESIIRRTDPGSI